MAFWSIHQLSSFSLPVLRLSHPRFLHSPLSQPIPWASGISGAGLFCFFFQVDKFLLKIKPFHFFSSLLKVKMDQVLSSFTIQANHSCHLGWHNSRALPGHLHTQGRTHNFTEMELCRFFLSHFLRSAGSYGHFWKSVNIKLRRCFKQLPLSC